MPLLKDGFYIDNVVDHAGSTQKSEEKDSGGKLLAAQTYCFSVHKCEHLFGKIYIVERDLHLNLLLRYRSPTHKISTL